MIVKKPGSVLKDVKQLHIKERTELAVLPEGEGLRHLFLFPPQEVVCCN